MLYKNAYESVEFVVCSSMRKGINAVLMLAMLSVYQHRIRLWRRLCAEVFTGHTLLALDKTQSDPLLSGRALIIHCGCPSLIIIDG